LRDHSGGQSTHILRAARRDGGSAIEESLINSKYVHSKGNKA
jgi:hypothetical protein